MRVWQLVIFKTPVYRAAEDPEVEDKKVGVLRGKSPMQVNRNERKIEWGTANYLTNQSVMVSMDNQQQP